MILTKPVIKRINEKVNTLLKEDKDDITVDRLVKEIKVYLLKGAMMKGIPVNIAEDVTARLVLLIALVDPVQVR